MPQQKGAEAAGPTRMVKVNPEIIRGSHQRVKFLKVRDDGGDLTVDSGQLVELTDAEYKKVKGEKDTLGKSLVVEAKQGE